MILAINTSTLQFGLALLKDDGSIMAEHLTAGQKGHFGHLMPALEFLLSGLSASIQDTKALVVAKGPGSFTGLRVGLSFAKGLCYALGVPLIGVSSLEALAHQVPSAGLPITPVLDSRKGELFTAQYIWSEAQTLTKTMEDASTRLDQFPSMFKVQTVFVGNNFPVQAPLITQVMGPGANLAPPVCWNLRASSVGSLGIVRYHARDFDDPKGLTPIYLRPPEIRPNPAGLMDPTA